VGLAQFDRQGTRRTNPAPGALPFTASGPYFRSLGSDFNPDDPFLYMAISIIRAALGSTLALVAVSVPCQRIAAQAPMSGVEQARRDSIRRPYNAADITFMSGMISHHAQAVKMAGWCPSHDASKSLQIYCGRVAMAQTAEIGLMQAWLKDRNQPVPDADPMGMKMMMGGKDMFMMMPG